MEDSLKKASDVVAALLNRRQNGEEGTADAIREPRLPPKWPEKLPFRKRPKPYSNSIPWTPANAELRHSRTRPYELFVAQSVLREVRQHLITARSGAPFGFLIGEVVYCPWTETPYIVIDGVRRETQELPPANEFDRFRRAWVAATREARRRRAEVLGWYHRHGVLGLRLSEWDLHLQEEFFPEPWHCALVIASTSRGIVGGFIQRSRHARLFRKGLAPFHELVELDAKYVDGRKPSCVDWENYAAGEAVSVIRSAWPSPASRLENWKSPDHGREVELPVDSALELEAPGRRPSPKRPSGGRSWRRGEGDRTHGTPEPPRPVKESGFTEEFSEVVGPPPGEPEAPAAARGGEDAADEPADASPEEAHPVGEARGKKDAGQDPRQRRARDGAVEGEAPKEGAGERETALEGTEGAAPEEASDRVAGRGAAPGEAWFSDDFADKDWGTGRGADADDISERDFERAAAGADRPSGGDGPGRARIYAAEPSETDRAGSLEWLLSLIGESIAARRRSGDADDDGLEAAEEAAEQIAARAATDRAAAEEAAEAAAAQRTAAREAAERAAAEKSAAEKAARRAAADRQAAEEALAKATADREAAEEALKRASADKAAAERAKREKAAAEKAAAEMEAARQAAERAAAEEAAAEKAAEKAAADEAAAEELVRRAAEEREKARQAAAELALPPPTPQPRPGAGMDRTAFVKHSDNPEEDPEAEIPVVMFREDRRGPTPRQIRIGAALVALVVLALLGRAMFAGGDGDESIAEQPVAPTNLTPFTPPAEFVELADAYLTDLQGLREQMTAHRLGQVECTEVTESFAAVLASHATLADYVAAEPSVTERFQRLDSEFLNVRQRVAATGCEMPSLPEPAAPGTEPGQDTADQPPGGDSPSDPDGAGRDLRF